ncbi:MAG: valine--tRNA ligase [Patescibacteria group bacterium]
MDSKFIPAQYEDKLNDLWEKKGYFKAKVDPSKKPFSIILPPPNANGSLHVGHVMFIYEDIMIRYHKLIGEEVLWLLGLDHAGIETQFVFERHLNKQGKSRFDYDRETLFKMIWDFVMENKGTIKGQLRKLGFALDWSKEKFTMDPEVVKTVYKTFKELYDQDLVYRAYRLINYCTRCGTSYSDYEVDYKEQVDPLYYMKYGPFTLATTRPETKFGDTGVAVNPKDKRYKEYIGQEIEVEGLNGTFKVKVVGDDAVDMKFGTGVVKVTPAHDFTDYEIGQRHNLPMKQVIDFRGKLMDIAGPYAGLNVNDARKRVAEDLQTKGLMVKIDENYTHRVGKCYKCGRTIEPLPKEQWFIKIKPLADKAKEVVENGTVKFYPKRYKRQSLQLLDKYVDCNISRQVVWGIQIPAYMCQSTHKWFISTEKPTSCEICKEDDFIQDTDTFDTWFSSSQWPFATLMTEGKEFYDYFYPTAVIETGFEILRPWVLRMIMLGEFVTNKEPFQTIFLHGMVRDKKGQKMSKSKGNVINPLEAVEKYGADALRAALIFGIKEGADIPLPDDRIIGMRNFANKLWNMGRFIKLNDEETRPPSLSGEKLSEKEIATLLKQLVKESDQIRKKYIKYMDTYQFSRALDLIYHFMWHKYADIYIEQLKEPLQSGKIEVRNTLKEVLFGNLKLLHPYMPFVTDAIWQVFHGEESSVLEEGIEIKKRS